MNLKEAKIIRDRLLDQPKIKYKLTDIQDQVFCQSWQGNSYREIADCSGYEHDYIRQIGSHLWQLLSKATGKQVTKHNFHIILEQEYYRWQETTQPPPKQDWGEATNISQFWGRVAELTTLEQWVIDQRCCLVGIVGSLGVGKTALSVKFCQQVENHFEVTIWRSIQDAPLLIELLADIIKVLHPQSKLALADSETKMLSWLIRYLQRHRCLLVLDNWETILQPQREFLSSYLNGYQGYGELLKRLGEIQHKSCVLITSQEKPPEIATLEGDFLPVRVLRLQGLTDKAGAELLKAKGLTATKKEAQKLISYYSGNPLAIKIASTTIKDFFNSNIQDFLAQEKTICGGICQLLEQQFNKLSIVEYQLLNGLSISSKPMAIEELIKVILPSKSYDYILKIIKNLQEKSLIEKTHKGYILPPAISEYINKDLEFCSLCMWNP